MEEPNKPVEGSQEAAAPDSQAENSGVAAPTNVDAPADQKPAEEQPAEPAETPEQKTARVKLCTENIQSNLEAFNCQFVVAMTITSQGNIPQVQVVAK